MACVEPKWIAWETMYVPCGKCIGCRKDKAKEWTIRMLHEKNSWRNSIFITLTYADSDDDVIPVLDKKEFVKFMKRLRKAKEPDKIKFYGVGEYGDTLGRAHYHAIIFGMSAYEGSLIEKAWPKGIVDVGTVTERSIAYVAGYVQKKYKEDPKMYDDLEIERPFQLQSKGIGKEWCEVNKGAIEERLMVTMNGKPQAVPRYYKKVLDLDLTKFEIRHKEVLEELYEKWLKKGIKDEEMHERWKKCLAAKKRTMIRRDELNNMGQNR